MANLKTKYMGLDLKNPIIAGASNLTLDIENLKKMEEAGAAAIVFKSLFEEQIQLENLEIHELLTEYDERNAEMVTIFPGSIKKSSYPVLHLEKLKKAKEAVSIPVIASLNALTDASWVEYAKEIEAAGVDGLELNFYTVPEKSAESVADIEKKQLETFRKIRSEVKLPIAVKLSPFYTNPLKLITDLDKAGADAVVLFNRLFQPDIDTNSEKHLYPYSLSNTEDNRLPLRFAGLLYDNIKASVCSNTGIFSGNDVIKMLLAGADAVQVVSTLYLNQIEVIESMITDAGKWMDSKGYKTIGEFRGKLSKSLADDALPYQRTQYIDFKMSTSAILKKYKAIS
ncbi:MAG: dihydroorotate dehydrogenase-like protein [Bacteroidales bacterium]|jgi:dihydroorotate dehydrogenase (fumarate)|nr:dihydroorotate dehydrogenase-like protein [Bacteroidales bacterium]